MTSLECLLKLLLTLKDGRKRFLTPRSQSEERSGFNYHSVRWKKGMTRQEKGEREKSEWEEDIRGGKEVGLEDWPSRFKCPHGFTPRCQRLNLAPKRGRARRTV